MSNLSQNSDLPPSEDDEKSCFVTVSTDHEGMVFFECGWQDGEANIDFLATILYKLKYDNLITILLEDLYEKCADSGRQEEFNRLLVKFTQLQEHHVSNKNKDDVAISPLDIKP